MREVVHSNNVAPNWRRREEKALRTYACLLPARLPATQAKPRADQPLPLPAVAQSPGVSASARHERCMSPPWSTIAPVIGPLACRCTAYRLSVDPNFFKKSRGRFSLLKGPSSVSILFPRYSSKRNQIFVLTLQSSNCCSASPSCASLLSIQSVILAKRFQDISPRFTSHISHPSVHHVSPAASRPLRA